MEAKEQLSKGAPGSQLRPPFDSAPCYRRASVNQIPLARGLRHLPSPLRWLHLQKQTLPAHAAFTSILVASAKPNPTSTWMTPARSCCFPGAKSHRRTDDRASLSLRLCGLQHLPSAKANITGTRRRHLHPCCLRQAKSTGTRLTPAHSRCFPGPKSHQHTNDVAAHLWTKSHPARPEHG